MIYIFGIQIRKSLKTKPRNTVLKESGITSTKRTPKIIASLTTFPERINTVEKTIKTILNQTLKPDEVVLWLAESQFPKLEEELPSELLKLKEFGLQIKWCHDIKSYKKLIPALYEYKHDIIITFDDDIYYDRDIVECLYKSYLNEPDCIHTNRAHRIYVKQNTIIPKPNSDVYWQDYSKADFKNTIIGCGGVLYPPDCFCDEVFNEKAFKDILPSQDDVWFWAMAVLSKRKIKTVKAYSMQIQNVEGSQKFGLCKINNKNSNSKNSFKKISQKYPELIKTIKEEK